VCLIELWIKFRENIGINTLFGHPCFRGMKMELLEAIRAAYDTTVQYATVDFRFILLYYKGLMYKKG